VALRKRKKVIHSDRGGNARGSRTAKSTSGGGRRGGGLLGLQLKILRTELAKIGKMYGILKTGGGNVLSRGD